MNNQLRTKIKICGLTSIEDARIVNDNKVDFAGIVMFYPKSRRNMEPEAAAEVLGAIAPDIRKVAVVVSITKEQLEIIDSMKFDYIQIHGELTEDVLKSAKTPILRAFNVNNMQMPEYYENEPKVAGYVFDAHTPGSGKTFDWTLLDNVKLSDDGSKILLLAGGLNADNVEDAIKYLHPYGVDVSSGVENESGCGKDADKAAAFVNKVREADRQVK